MSVRLGFFAFWPDAEGVASQELSAAWGNHAATVREDRAMLGSNPSARDGPDAEGAAACVVCAEPRPATSPNGLSQIHRVLTQTIAIVTSRCHGFMLPGP